MNNKRKLRKKTTYQDKNNTWIGITIRTNQQYHILTKYFQGRRIGFQSGGAMEHWKVLSATMVGRQEKCLNSRGSRMVKTIIFWPWWQPFNSFCFKTISSFSLSATQNSGGGGAMAPPALIFFLYKASRFYLRPHGC